MCKCVNVNVNFQSDTLQQGGVGRRVGAREQRQGREEYREATRPAKRMIIWIIIIIRIFIFIRIVIIYKHYPEHHPEQLQKKRKARGVLIDDDIQLQRGPTIILKKV